MQVITRYARCALAVHLSLLAAGAAAAVMPPPRPDLVTQARALMGEENYAEAVPALQRYVEQNPYDGAAWGDLGYSLHALKRWNEAIPAYARAAELGSRPETQWYNTACAHALLGNKDQAITWLKKALDARFAEQRTLENDTDLDPLRADPRFVELTGLNPPAGLNSQAQWAWDLAFLVRRMEQMHWDLYGKVGRDTFRAEIERLKADAPELSPGEARLRLARVLALVGDGHTNVAAAAIGEQTLPRLPLHLFIFSDGVFVIGASQEHEELVGARVLKVGSLDAGAAVEAVKPYISVDNPMGYPAIAPGRLVNPAMLRIIGAAPDDTGCQYTLLTRDGKERTVRLTPVAVPAGGPHAIVNPNFRYVHHVTGKTPLYLESADQPLWIRHVPEHGLVYARFWTVTNTPDLSLADFAEQLVETAGSSGAERLVIDMRFNGGGNTGLLRPLLTRLIASEAINHPGRLFVIIGRHTFSAAQNCVNMMEDTLPVTFVGEPTGSCPAFIGESTFLVLPYSKLRVHCSSRYWQWGDSTDQRIWVAPRIAAPPSFAAYLHGRDDAMDALIASFADTPE